jgi:hypothetical protein
VAALFAGVAARIGAGVTARIANWNLLLHHSLDHSAAVHFNLVRNLLAFPGLVGVRDLLSDADRVALGLALRDTLILTNLALFPMSLGLVAADRLADRSCAADLFALRARDLHAHFARNPDLLGLVLRARVAAVIAATLTLEQARESLEHTGATRNTLVFVVSFIDRFGLPGRVRLGRPVLFLDRDGLLVRNADAVRLFDDLPHRNLLITSHRASTLFGNLNTLVTCFLDTNLFGFVTGLPGCVVLRNALSDTNLFVLHTG